MIPPLSGPGLPVQPRPALGAHVTAQLRRLIISGELPPQTHLVEAQLSQTFDVSRGPIRDALRQLEAEELVASRRRGMFVVGLSPDDIEELYSLRELLELKALQLIDPATEAGRWTIIESPLERMRGAAEAQDASAFAEADLAFHSAFYALAGHGRLESVWRQYEPTFAVMLAMTNAEDRDLGPTFADHVQLYELVSSGDAGDAAATLREHLDGSRQRLLRAYHRLFPSDDAQMSG